MKKFTLFLVNLLLIVSCSKDMLIEQNEIRFNVSHETKASASFDVDDSFSLYAVEYDGETPGALRVGSNYMNNEQIVFNGSSWQGKRALYWSPKPCDFYALSPYQQSIPSVESYLFSVSLNQNGGGYKSSDLMFASATKVAKEDGSVDLMFNHILSNVKVVLEKGPSYKGEIPSDAVAKLYNTYVDCKVNFLTGSVEQVLFSPRKTIEMEKLSDDQFQAIVVPQNIERRTPLVELTMGGMSYLLETSISFRPGFSYELKLILNSSPDQEQIEISIDPSIRNW